MADFKSGTCLWSALENSSLLQKKEMSWLRHLIMGGGRAVRCDSSTLPSVLVPLSRGGLVAMPCPSVQFPWCYFLGDKCQLRPGDPVTPHSVSGDVGGALLGKQQQHLQQHLQQSPHATWCALSVAMLSPVAAGPERVVVGRQRVALGSTSWRRQIQ